MPALPASAASAPRERESSEVVMPPRSGGGLRSRGWRGPESNRRHHGFQPCALPTELPRPKTASVAVQARKHRRPYRCNRVANALLGKTLVGRGPAGNRCYAPPGRNFRKVREAAPFELSSRAVGLAPDRRLGAG